MSYFELVILSCVIVLPCFVIVVLFIRSSHWFSQQEHLHHGASTTIPEHLSSELGQLNLPAQKIEQVSRHVTKMVDKEVQHQSEKIRIEMKNSYEKIIKSYDKIIETKDKTLESTKKEYESIRQNFQTLGKEKKQTESVVRSIAKGLIVINDQGEVVFVNPVAENILGVKAENLIGKSISNTDGEHVVSLVGDDGVEDPQFPELSSKNRGTKDILKESTAVIQGISGQTKGMVSILTGLAQQKKVDEYKTEFLANVTHELRSPLICILKSISAINEELKHASEEHRNYLRIALRNAQQLEKLVNDILDVSKMEAGKMPLHYDIVSAKSLLHDVRSMFSIWARDKSIEVIEKIQDDVVFEADPERLRQVVVNLAANALKFTPKGGKITFEAVECGPRNGPAPAVQISVRDTGPGLSEQDRKNLFQKFASGLHSEGNRGTGLGLTIAKEIIELHKGRIWAENNEKHGSHFAFSIPQYQNAANRPSPPSNISGLAA